MSQHLAGRGVKDYATLLDWRRVVADLYAAIRAEADPKVAHALWVQRRRALFSSHVQSPVEAVNRSTFDGPHVFAYDSALRFSVRLDACDGAPLDLDTGQDGTLRLLPFARTLGLAQPLGAELTVYWVDTYGGGAFLPFRDATCGGETYGGGRYLIDGAKSADLGRDATGCLILDFNFAYYPSCAYSARYVCPLAPRSNCLTQAIRGGERSGLSLV